jgi:hypothetical protein
MEANFCIADGMDKFPDEGSIGFVHRGFRVLWYDALSAAWDSRAEVLPSWMHRTAILTGIFSVEAAANCCIDSLGLSNPIAADFEKLSAIAKLNLFSLVKTQKALDLGVLPLQQLKEAIGIRNDFVHMKRAYAEMEWSSGKLTHSRKPNSQLKISIDPEEWNTESVATVLLAISQFFYFYFHDCCQLSFPETYSILQDAYVRPDKSTHPYSDLEFWPLGSEKLVSSGVICPKWWDYFYSTSVSPRLQ